LRIAESDCGSERRIGLCGLRGDSRSRAAPRAIAMRQALTSGSTRGRRIVPGTKVVEACPTAASIVLRYLIRLTSRSLSIPLGRPTSSIPGSRSRSGQPTYFHPRETTSLFKVNNCTETGTGRSSLVSDDLANGKTEVASRDALASGNSTRRVDGLERRASAGGLQVSTSCIARIIRRR